MSIRDVLGLVKTSLSGDPAVKLERQREVLTRLKFIGTVGPGEKIDVRSMRVETGGILTPIRRLISGESRDNTHGLITNTVERSFEVLMTYLHSDRKGDICTAANIVKDLLAAGTGLKNIQKTYKDDKLFVCNIETILEHINSRLTELKETHPKIFMPPTSLIDTLIAPVEENPASNKKSK